MDPHARRRPPLGRAGAVALAVAVVGIAVGAVLLIQAHAAGLTVATFGWFAYAPLPDDAASPLDGLVILTRGQAAGLLSLGIGAAALAYLAGLRFGRGSR